MKYDVQNINGLIYIQQKRFHRQFSFLFGKNPVTLMLS